MARRLIINRRAFFCDGPNPKGGLDRMQSMEDTPIRHVTDTALWVATFRARETERGDALFRDPLARLLVGEEGERIAKQMQRSTAVGWSVVVRTCLIDSFLTQALTRGIDGVLNLGAGLDTRPYRMDLPSGLLWIEVDHPQMIAFKEERLKNERPKCRLERVGLDLSDPEARKRLLSEVQSKCQRVLVLTEGVLPYLSNENVQGLAQDLHAHSHMEFWIVDYWSRFFAERMRKSKTFKKLKNAPFLFDPPDWRTFFAETGWDLEEMRFMGYEGRKLGRPAPFPIWMKLLRVLMPAEQKDRIAKMSGYALLRAHRA